MERPLSRRAFTKRATALLGGLSAAVLSPLTSAARPKHAQKRNQTTYPYWVLDPNHDTGPFNPETGEYDSNVCNANGPTRDCSGCNACQHHAANKLFATDDISDALRAHTHCRCQVVKGGELPHETWTALFGPHHNPQRLSVDRRDQRTQSILRAHGA